MLLFRTQKLRAPITQLHNRHLDPVLSGLIDGIRTTHIDPLLAKLPVSSLVPPLVTAGIGNKE